jgi:hypothetical protein
MDSHWLCNANSRPIEFIQLGKPYPSGQRASPQKLHSNTRVGGSMKVTKLFLGGVLAMMTFATSALAQDQNYPPPNNNPQNNYPQNDNSYPQNSYPQNQQGLTIPAGTNLSIRADQEIKAKDVSKGMTYQAEIANDVNGPNGNVIIPRGTPAQLVVVSTNPNNNSKDLALALNSVNLNGRNYMVQSNTVNGASGAPGGIGANKRTGEYVGGGALAGAVIGAIAGGGKGAAIGAVLGGAGGAGAQVLTHGHQINVPAETVLNFKLEQPIYMN